MSFVFSILFVLSFAVFSFADTSNATDKNIFQDADQDGLSNDEERLYGTNPHQVDTDGDGYSDGTEIKSGYDPLKPSPGDNLNVTAAKDSQTDHALASDNTVVQKTNLTEEVSRQVALKLKESATNQQNLSLENLQETVQNTMSEKIDVGTLPKIDRATIKIQKQKYSSLSPDERTIKIKEDAMNYVTAVSYIFANNSPITMQSDSDMQQLASFVTANSMGVLSGNNSALLDDFTQKGKLITEQLQSITVPENMLETHIKALSLAQYATTFKDGISSNSDNDPLAQITILAKAQGFIGLFAAFSNDIRTTLSENGITDSLK